VGRRSVRNLTEDVLRTSRLRVGGPAVGYLGYVGRENAGDEAIREGQELLHPRAVLRPLPIGLQWGQVLAALGRRGVPALGGRAVLLGGGTVVGRADWRTRLEQVRAASPGTPVAMLGAGVEDPEFLGRRRYTSPEELRAWAPVLAGFAGVSVRGPRSAELLAGIGVTAPVVGDPALALGDATPRRDAVQDGLIGVNVAVPEDVHGGDTAAVERSVAEVVARLVRRGARVRLVPMHPHDAAASERLVLSLADAERARVEIVPTAVGGPDTVAALRPCEVVLGQRLHTVVLGCAALVPSLAVAYRPKSDDFLASVGRPEWSLRSTDLSAVEVADRVLALARDRDRQVEHLQSVVGGLREALHAEAARLQVLVPALAGR